MIKTFSFGHIFQMDCIWCYGYYTEPIHVLFHSIGFFFKVESNTFDTFMIYQLLSEYSWTKQFRQLKILTLIKEFWCEQHSWLLREKNSDKRRPRINFFSPQLTQFTCSTCFGRNQFSGKENAFTIAVRPFNRYSQSRLAD